MNYIGKKKGERDGIFLSRWNALVARRHEHLLFCPVTHEKCKGEACEWWDVEELGCAVIRVAKKYCH